MEQNYNRIKELAENHDRNSPSGWFWDNAGENAFVVVDEEGCIVLRTTRKDIAVFFALCNPAVILKLMEKARV